MTTLRPDKPRLLADIGATYARFCVERIEGRFEHIAILACDEYGGFTEVVEAYLAELPGARPDHAAIAIANPVEGDRVQMTNRDWCFSIREAQTALKLRTLLVVNNFTALAMALPHLSRHERRQVGSGSPQPDGVIGLIGPGTGLGVSGLIPTGDRWVTLATEGGHAGFAPADDREVRILQYAWRKLPRVSAERLVSGPGLELIHEALAAEGAGPGPVPPLGAAEIVRRALDGEDARCRDALDVFCAMLGTMASDLALTLGATGGIYVGGGIVPRLGEYFDRSPFRERFEAKGRFTGYVARIPTYVITGPNPAFHGVSSLLTHHLPNEGSSPLLERVRAARDSLSPAERRVAGYVLDNPRSMLNDPIGLIASGAQVSQPTVIRFCRTLGFQGLADFKLKLASGLTGTVPVQRTQVHRHDGTADLSAKVLDNTISAIVQFRESLNVEAVDRAIALLRQAKRVEIFAVGNSAIVALDAQHKFMRLRVPSAAHVDASTVGMAADMLEPGSVALFVSSSGTPPELNRAATVAVERGVPVVAITASQSPLARRASVCVGVDHSEDVHQFLSMLSRILHLLALDTLAVGVAVRTPAGEPLAAGRATADPADGQVRPAAGVLISHVA
ncbi:MAG: glucokinase [Ideonella sp.]|nr:glucokinase [Ideonella sp.]